MKMKGKTLGLLIVVLMALIAISCVGSEVSWSSKEAAPDPVREIVGLPSIAVGNLNPAARNPGLELVCTGFYDTPGGYCNYFANGVPYINFTLVGNITVSDSNK
jgi:hypothetical protein